MLPDFPDSKKQLQRSVIRRITALEKARHPLLAQIRSFTQHEGKTLLYERVDSGSKLQHAREEQVSIQIRFDEVPKLTGENLEKKLLAMAEAIGAAKMKSIFAKLEEITDETGLKVDAKGRPLDASLILDMLDMGETGFDESGKPTSSFVFHPDMMPAVKRAADEVENDPELKRRLEEINNKHRQQWIDRENRRKLVD